MSKADRSAACVQQRVCHHHDGKTGESAVAGGVVWLHQRTMGLSVRAGAQTVLDTLLKRYVE